MANSTVALLNEGKRLITGALTGFTPIGPSYFKIGNTAGFTANKEHTDITGTLVYTGLSGLIQSRRIRDDTVRYTMTIPEDAGPFDIGNIMLWMSHADNTPAPVASIVLPSLVAKLPGAINLENSTPFPTPGTRFVIALTIKHTVDELDAEVEIIVPEFSSLAFYASENDVPPPLDNPWLQFVVMQDSRTDRPALVSKKDSNSYWGIPFFTNLRHPYFGVLDGGQVGDGRKGSTHGWIWGRYFTTLTADYDGQIGGSNFANPGSGYMGTVGGLGFDQK